MDVSLDEIIKQKKLSMPKRKPGQQKQQPQRRQQQQQQRGQGTVKRQQQVGDARDRISKLRKQSLIGQDARGRIQQRKRLNIKDARQLLAGGKKQLPRTGTTAPAQQQLQAVRRQAAGPAGPAAGLVSAGPLVVPKKVVANNLYRQRPAPPPQLEYEDDDDYSAARQRPGLARLIPVQVSRQRRERSRSPVRRYAPPPTQPLPPPPPPTAAQSSSSATIVQAYKVSINNLHTGVTREDIYELFSSVGQVKKCVLLQPGAAEVVYPSKEHALAAIRRYDRRELDGMPMQLRLSVVGIKVHAASGAGGGSSARSSAAGAIDERAVRAALFRTGEDHRHHSGGRPVNFKVSV